MARYNATSRQLLQITAMLLSGQPYRRATLALSQINVAHRWMRSSTLPIPLPHPPSNFRYSPPLAAPSRNVYTSKLSSTVSDYDPDPSTYGELYEMIPLPDSMMDTTIFVGKLCEFVNEDMLSKLFQEVTDLPQLPTCVARKPDASSMRYGFVTFPSAEEAQAAISLFDGHELNGVQIKVQPIRDHDPSKRVRVPGQLVTYVLGTSRRPKKTTKPDMSLRRISRDDVDRLSRGQPAKKKGSGSRRVPHRLNQEERDHFDRAARMGYLSMDGTGYRRGRKGSPLGNIHRQWCDARAKPQIIHCKASGGRMLDNLIVDFSPLRIGGMSADSEVVNEILTTWKLQVALSAEEAGMTLMPDYEEDNTTNDISNDETEYLTFTIGQNGWADEPIWRLPVISIGVFEGERSKAKLMAKQLAVKWEVMDIHTATQRGNANNKQRSAGAINRKTAGAKRGGRTKMKGLREYRRKND